MSRALRILERISLCAAALVPLTHWNLPGPKQYDAPREVAPWPPAAKGSREAWAEIAVERGMRELSRQTMRWLVAPRSLRRFGAVLGWFGPIAMSCAPHAFAAQVDAIVAAASDWRFADELRAVNAPTLVIVGSQDILTPRGDSEELAERIPGAELVVVPGAAHGLMVEHAGPYNAAVLAFLRGTAAAGIAACA